VPGPAGGQDGHVRITALAGGVGGARFLAGLLAALGPGDHTDDVTVVGNVGDDLWVWGLRVCPDLDTVMYTLGGGIDAERGWGRVDESWRLKEELAAYGVQPQWFGLGDRDLATHVLRTQLLGAGATLTEVTAGLCSRWRPGVTLLPVTDDRSETHVLVERDGATVGIHFQEWWVRHRAELPALDFVGVGSAQATPTPAVLQAIADADVVLLPPSNPVVSIGAILRVPGVRAAVQAAVAPVVGLSPIVGGVPVRGMADACLSAIGVDVSAAAVGVHYGARSQGGLLDGWLVDDADAGALVPGVEVRAVPLLMHDVDATARMAEAALDLASALRGTG